MKIWIITESYQEGAVFIDACTTKAIAERTVRSYAHSDWYDIVEVDVIDV